MDDQRESKVQAISKINKKMQIISFIRYVSILIVLFSLVFNFVLQISVVNGDSMYPTIKQRSIVVNSALTSKMTKPNRFDIVVVKEEDKQIIKRVVGLPGEKVEYKDNYLYINGQHIEEEFLNFEYIKSQTNNLEIPFTSNFGPVVLGADEYYVLGDNRRVSKDSRILGPIHENDILTHDVLVIK